MLLTDEGEIQLWGKSQFLQLYSQTDVGFNFALVIIFLF